MRKNILLITAIIAISLCGATRLLAAPSVTSPAPNTVSAKQVTGIVESFTGTRVVVMDGQVRRTFYIRSKTIIEGMLARGAKVFITYKVIKRFNRHRKKIALTIKVLPPPINKNENTAT
jgi:hypothetical protein